VEVSNQIQLKFHGVDFPVINLNSEEHFLQGDENNIDIDITPKVFYPKELPEYFKIIQEIKLTADNYFSLFIVAVGTFEIKADIDEKIKKAFVNVNAPAIMFPYIRSFISTLTTNLGNVTGPLTIPTQFFKGDLEEIKDIPQ
jgi:preprotein translocase subunit SecB